MPSNRAINNHTALRISLKLIHLSSAELFIHDRQWACAFVGVCP